MRFVCVPDEEAEEVERPRRPTSSCARACAATSRSPASRPTCTSAFRRRACCAIRVGCEGTAAHGSTPWLGDNAILKALDVFRRIESLPFSRESSDLFDRPSINLARISGGDAFNKVPDRCSMDVDIRYLPEPGPRRDPRRRSAALADVEIVETLHARAGDRVAHEPVRARAARGGRARAIEGEALSVGRDGASDAMSFLEAGDPGGRVRPGRRRPPRPRGVGVGRLARALPQALGDFMRRCPPGCERRRELRAVGGDEA